MVWSIILQLHLPCYYSLNTLLAQGQPQPASTGDHTRLARREPATSKRKSKENVLALAPVELPGNIARTSSDGVYVLHLELH